MRSAAGQRPLGSYAPDIVGAFTLTIASVGFAVTLAVLIFGGPLESGLPRAIGSFVVGSGVMSVAVALRSNIVPVATFVQEGPAILLAAVCADFIARAGAEVAGVFVLLVITMVLTALVTWLIGHRGLGRLGFYLPKPVIGAFVGGTGWLLLKGGFDVMTNTTLGLADLGALFGAEHLRFWVPGLVIGLIAWIAGRSERVPSYALGLMLCAFVGAFYATVAMTSSLSVVEADGWLLGPFPETGGAQLVTPAEFRATNWSSIAAALPGMLGVVGLACLGQLFSLTGIRSELAPQLDIDAELRTSARANLGAALFGMSPGYQGFGYCVLLNRLGATRRAAPMISGGALIGFGLVGVTAVGYVPRFIVGALLVMIGLALLDTWAQGVLHSVGACEFLLGLAIVGAIAWFGLLQGIGLGLVVTALVWIGWRGRFAPVRSTRNGHQLRRRIDLTQLDHERLVGTDARLTVVELQGYLFAEAVASVEEQLTVATHRDVGAETLVLDFANVTGIDCAGRVAIGRLLIGLSLQPIEIWLSGLNPALNEKLRCSRPELVAHVRFSPSLDIAIGHAEDRLRGTKFAELQSAATKPIPQLSYRQEPRNAPPRSPRPSVSTLACRTDHHLDRDRLDAPFSDVRLS